MNGGTKPKLTRRAVTLHRYQVADFTTLFVTDIVNLFARLVMSTIENWPVATMRMPLDFGGGYVRKTSTGVW